MSGKTLRLGTRGSALARWQADWVAARLRDSGVQVELVPIATSGDVQQRGPISDLGGIGVFTKELQRALLDNEIDLAVHSLKDLPTEPIEGLTLAAVPHRGPVGDCLCSRDGAGFDDLPQGALIGTGSVRRQSQLLYARRDLRMADIRGNVETRLEKLRRGDYDAIVLAEAGLERLGLEDAISQRLPQTLLLPAVGQGALGVEARADDDSTLQALPPLNDEPTEAAVVAERSLLFTLRAGCLAPVGAFGRVEDGRLILDAAVLDPGGTQRLAESESGGVQEAEPLGRRVAESLLRRGAAALIQAAHP